MHCSRLVSHIASTSCVLGALAVGACADGGSSGSATCDAPGTAKVGPADAHCAGAVTVVPSECTATPVAGDEEEPAIVNGQEGDDDDCKYHVAWTSTALCDGPDVTFTVTLTAKDGGDPVLGAAPDIESYMTDMPNHLIPNGQATTELGNGVYRIGPIRFTMAGEWVVRFHFFEDCADTEASPHGHVSFAVEIP